MGVEVEEVGVGVEVVEVEEVVVLQTEGGVKVLIAIGGASCRVNPSGMRSSS